jgi:hypothetical protein
VHIHIHIYTYIPLSAEDLLAIRGRNKPPEVDFAVDELGLCVCVCVCVCVCGELSMARDHVCVLCE